MFAANQLSNRLLSIKLHLMKHLLTVTDGGMTIYGTQQSRKNEVNNIIYLCGHQSLSVITSLLCVVTHHSCAATDLPCALNNLNMRSLILSCTELSALCSHRSFCTVTDLLCAITDLSVRSPICPARCCTTMCGHQPALYGERSLCGHTELSL